MCNFTDSASTDSFGLAWGPDTIDKEWGTSPEEIVPQAQPIAAHINPPIRPSVRTPAGRPNEEGPRFLLGKGTRTLARALGG